MQENIEMPTTVKYNSLTEERSRIVGNGRLLSPPNSLNAPIERTYARLQQKTT
jgi:hypothetical protein